MDDSQSNVHVYPIEQHWQIINRVLGLWTWFVAIVDVALHPLMLLFKWTRKAVPISLVGWPDGGIEDDLHRYAPQLFCEQR